MPTINPKLISEEPLYFPPKNPITDMHPNNQNSRAEKKEQLSIAFHTKCTYIALRGSIHLAKYVGEEPINPIAGVRIQIAVQFNHRAGLNWARGIENSTMKWGYQRQTKKVKKN